MKKAKDLPPKSPTKVKGGKIAINHGITLLRVGCGVATVALLFASPLAESPATAQSPSCEITQVTFTTGGNSFTNSLASPPPISGDGTRIVFPFDRDVTGGNPGERDEIFLYDATAGAISQITNLGSTFFPSISGDGTHIAFVSAADLTGGNADHNGEIFLYDVAAASFTQVTHTTGLIFPTVFPSTNGDGTRIAFLSELDLTGGNADGNREVFIYDSPTGSLVQITNTLGWMVNNAPLISADGARLAFNSDADLTGANPDLELQGFLYEVQTGVLTQLTHSTTGFTAITSIDGHAARLTLVSDRDLTGGNPDGNFEAFLYDSATGHLTQITNTAGHGNVATSISGDGARIAVASNGDFTGGNADGNIETFLYDVWSGRFAQVTNTTGALGFIPPGGLLNRDGTRLSFVSTKSLTGGNPDGNVEIFVATCTRDSDEDGVPDNSDPDTVGDVVTGLPGTSFHSAGNKNAFLSRLEAIEKLIRAGKIDQAIHELQNLREHVDGCGSSADNNDWITDCTSQQQVRSLLDTLIANLSS